MKLPKRWKKEHKQIYIVTKEENKREKGIAQARMLLLYTTLSFTLAINNFKLKSSQVNS